MSVFSFGKAGINSCTESLYDRDRSLFPSTKPSVSTSQYCLTITVVQSGPLYNT